MSCVNVPVVQPSKISELDYQLWGQKDFPILQITSSLGLGYKYQAISLLFPPRRKSVCGNQSLERQHDSGRVSAESGPVNWAGVSQAEGEAVFTTSAAQTTDSWSQNSSSLEPELQGKPKLTHLLTLRKPRPDRPPTPARQKKHTHTHRLNSEFLSYEVITVLTYYTLTCTKSPLCSQEVELCCLQPHTLASYVIRPVLFNRLLCASSRQRLGCRIHSFEYNRYSTSLGRLITISSTAVFLSSWNSWNVLTSPSLVLPIQYCCSLLRDYAP